MALLLIGRLQLDSSDLKYISILVWRMLDRVVYGHTR